MMANLQESNHRRFRPAWTLLLFSFTVASASQAATMRVEEATVSQAGETATICVRLESDGEEVAGTQNDLIWDGDCATLTAGSCEIATPGKELNTAFPPGSNFTMRAFVLALDDLEPIPDGDLYCCDFISELTGPGSCPIRVTNALAASPTGRAIRVQTHGGAIRFTGSVMEDHDSAGCQMVCRRQAGGVPWIGGFIALAVLALHARRC